MTNANASSASADGFHALHITPTAAVELVQKNGYAHVVDVREEYEWENDHIPNTTSLPLSRARPEDFNRFAKDKPLLVLCQHGNRSMQVTQYLRSQGFLQVQSMSGGIEAYSDAQRAAISKALEGRK